ncbi:MAG: CopG family transcriptional regulator [Thermoplasmata archaeon]|nr:MAG: CopG family transcriptional regulator [Thermoplasmata archaeon]
MEKNQKSVKSVRFDDVHWNIIDGLTPFYGSNPGEVVRNIVLMWLHENLGSETIQELKKINAIKLKKDE